MKIFHNISIKNKLIVIILFTTFITIGINAIVDTIDDINKYKEDLVNSTITNAKLIGEYSVAPLLFRDTVVASDVIKKVGAIPWISTGCIYDENNNLFTSFQKTRDDLPVTVDSEAKHIFEEGCLKIFYPIEYNGVGYGTVYLKATTDELNKKINRQLLLSIIIFLGMLIISFLIASKLQTTISKPILDLAQTTSKITSEKNYSHRMQRKGSDEIGVLYDAFNEMLLQLNRHEEERNNTEELLRESEEKYRRIVDTSLEGIWGFDKNFNTTFVNTRIAEILGYSCDEMNGQPITKFMFAEDISDHNKKVENFTKGLAENYERRFYRKDGKVVWLTVSATPILNSNQQFNGSFGMFTDITERKLADERINKLIEEQTAANEELFSKNIELKRARNATLNIIEDLSQEIEDRQKAQLHAARLAAIVEYSDDAIIGKDLNGIITSWNKGAEKVYGYTENEIAGKHISLLVPAEYKNEVHDTLKKIMNGEHIEHYETIRQTKNKKFINVSLTISPVLNKDEKIIGASVIARDITNLKIAETALRESEERYRRITAGLTDYLYTVVIQNGKVTETVHNDACYFITGYTAKEFADDPYLWLNMVVPEDRSHVVDKFSKILEGKEILPIEHRILTKDGNIRWISDAAIPKYSSNGEIVSYDGVISDITERKQVEIELSKYREHLEELVKERTRQLETVNKELEAFAYSVSHDLHAPLRHINGFLKLLQGRVEKVLDEQSRHYMDVIYRSTNKMGTLIDDLLSFSRMGRKEMSGSILDLNIMIKNIIKELEPETHDRIINWHVSEIPVVFGDRTLLQTVLENLISNAVKFTRTRKQAEIEIGCLPEEDKETVVYIRDNGVGFDMNYTSKLFGVFQRLHRSEDFEGTGIGLANVHRIISRHGGRTWAVGKIDKGATFFFTLPKIKSEKEHENVKKNPSG